MESLFVNSWRQREQDMRQFDGFMDFKMEQDGDKYVVSSRCVTAAIEEQVCSIGGCD